MIKHVALKYISLDLFEKVYRLKCFISKHNIAQSNTTNSNENVVSLFDFTLTEVLNHLESIVTDIEDCTPDEMFSLQRRLSNTYLSIQKVHNQLKYLHTEWLTPETYIFVNHIINYLPESNRPENFNIILSDKYDFLEKNLHDEFLDITKVFSAGASNIFPFNPTLILPKIEYNNPLNWSILCHEIGHIDQVNISKLLSKNELYPSSISTTDRITLEKWAEEIYCDFFATNVLGPAYFLSLVSFALLSSLNTGIGNSSKTHPPFALRIALLFDYLDHNSLNVSISLDDQILPIHELFYKMLNEIDQTLRKLIRLKETDIKDLGVFSNYMKNYNEYKSILFQIAPEELENLKILIDKLKDDMPISSLRNLKKDQDYLMEFTDDMQIDAFKKIRDTLSEKPAEVWEILNAGWLYKFEHIIPEGIKIFFNNNNVSINKKLQQYGDLLDILDDRLLISIESSKLIEYIEN